MSRRQSKMSLLLGAFGRALVTGLALYGAKKLYDEYFSTRNAAKNDDTDLNGSDDSIWTSDVDNVTRTTASDRLDVYYQERVSVANRLNYARQMALLNDVCTSLSGLLDKALPRFQFGRMEIKSHDRLGTIGNGHNYTVYLPIVLNENLWQCVNGSETILPDAEGFHLLKRINSQLFKIGCDSMDTFLVGAYLSSSKLFSFVKERCLMMDTDKEMRYSLESKVCERIEFSVETETDCFSITLRVVARLTDKTTVVATGMNEFLWLKCTRDAEEAALNNLPVEAIRNLQCLLHCAGNDEVLREIPSSVFVNIIFYIPHNDTHPDNYFFLALNTLYDVLKCGNLRQFFNPYVNILKGMNARDIARFVVYLEQLSQFGYEPLFDK